MREIIVSILITDFPFSTCITELLLLEPPGYKRRNTIHLLHLYHYHLSLHFSNFSIRSCMSSFQDVQSSHVPFHDLATCRKFLKKKDRPLRLQQQRRMSAFCVCPCSKGCLHDSLLPFHTQGDQASSDLPDPTKLGHWKGGGRGRSTMYLLSFPQTVTLLFHCLIHGSSCSCTARLATAEFCRHEKPLLFKHLQLLGRFTFRFYHRPSTWELS